MTIIITSGTFMGTLPRISTSNLHGAIINMSYNAVLYASGTKPMTWSITRGSLPPGLELLNSGTITGSATAIGTCTFTVQALNSAGRDTKELTLTVRESRVITAPSITIAALNPGFAGAGYGVSLTASGTRPISWAIINGSIPGLELTDSGILYGTPATEGTYEITVQAQNTAGAASKSFSITINPAPLRMKPAITTTELEPGTVDTEYIFQFTASGTPPFRWEIIKGKLPNKMQLSSTGRLSGLVPKTGETTFTVRVSNAYGSDSRIFTLNSYKYPNITITILKDATVAKSYSLSLRSSGTKPLTWLLEGSLPTGMAFDASKGIIKGKPSLNGTYNLRVVASNPVDEEIKYLTLSVNAVLPKITPAKLSTGAVGKIYKTAIKTSGTTPINMTYDGYLPEGLSFNENTGMLYGTPTEACTDLPITVTASNMGGDTELTYFLTIKGDAPKITTSSLPQGSIGKDYSATLKLLVQHL